MFSGKAIPWWVIVIYLGSFKQNRQFTASERLDQERLGVCRHAARAYRPSFGRFRLPGGPGHVAPDFAMVAKGMGHHANSATKDSG